MMCVYALSAMECESTPQQKLIVLINNNIDSSDKKLNALQWCTKSIDEIWHERAGWIDWESVIENDLCCIKQLACSANPNTQDRSGRTLFSWACGNDHGWKCYGKTLTDEQRLEVINILLDNQHADLNKKDTGAIMTTGIAGATGFICACSTEKIAIVEILLQSDKIDFNATNRSNETAFKVLCTKYLCNHGFVKETQISYKPIILLLLKDNRVNKSYDEFFKAYHVNFFIESVLLMEEFNKILASKDNTVLFEINKRGYIKDDKINALLNTIEEKENAIKEIKEMRKSLETLQKERNTMDKTQEIQRTDQPWQAKWCMIGTVSGLFLFFTAYFIAQYS